MLTRSIDSDEPVSRDFHNALKIINAVLVLEGQEQIPVNIATFIVATWEEGKHAYIEWFNEFSERGGQPYFDKIWFKQ